MNKPKRGVALFLVLGTLFVVVAMAYVVLRIIHSQSYRTSHQVNRTRAYYAAQAGMWLAYDRLRRGTWTSASCPNPGGCLITSAYDSDLVDPTNGPITGIRIVFCPDGSTCLATNPCDPPPGINFCINVRVTYN